jgi:MFS family permease
LLRGTVVLRPSFDSSRHRAFGRNLALDLLVAVGVGVTLAVITSLLPTIARRGGLEPLGLAALGAAPFIANLLGAFAGRVGPRTTRQLSVLRGLGALALVAILVLPVPPVMVAVAIVYWLSLSLGGPLHLRLWGVMYPARVRGRVLGFAGMGRAAATALAALAGGVLADRLGGPPVIAIAGLIGAGCAVGYALFRAEAAGPPPGFSAREAVRALRERPVLARLALAQGFYGGGLIAAAPLYALVHVDRLELSLGVVGVIGIINALATTIAFPVWGAVSDRAGAIVGMRIGGVLGVLSLVGYALAPDVSILFVAAALGGIAGASIDVGISAVVSEQTSLADRSAAMAGWNALTGARGIGAAFLMSTLVQIGLVDVTVGLLLCGTASLLGVVLFVRARPGVPVETRAWEIGPATGRSSTAAEPG